MQTFTSVHQSDILGEITMFDRMILRGHLTTLYPEGAFQRFLSSQNVLLKDFGRYVDNMTKILKARIASIAEKQGRPMIYLAAAMTASRGAMSKEDLARQIAERDKISEGLICVLFTLETCMSFQVKANHDSHKLEVVRSPRKCLHYYLYFIDSEFGFMHVRIQSWFPFQIQVYLNGRAWLARQMDRLKIGYVRYENTFLWVEKVEAVQALCRKFLRRKWVRLLDAFARRVNPFLPLLRSIGFGTYWWVIDEAEIATDVMFRSRQRLEVLLPDILKYALTTFSSEDVLRFLGKKRLHGNFQGEVTSDMKRRPEGYRVKHRVKGNSIKAYDKFSVLRVETTISQPREFKVLRVTRRRRAPRRLIRRWQPMGKSVGNLARYCQVGSEANHRYLKALAQVPQRDKAVRELDSLCQPVSKDGRRFARLQPLSSAEREVFREVLSTDHAIHGVRNRDLRTALYGRACSTTPEETRRQCERVSRTLRKLWAHGLIYRVRNANLYRVTSRGYRVMSAVLAFHNQGFSEAYRKAS
jgi:hypothetical protein